MSKQFVLPDLFSTLPFEGRHNKHHGEAGAESRAWFESYDMFTDSKKAFIVSGQNELLVSYAYPFADYEQFRTVCDFVNLLFVVDEFSDDQNAEDARDTCQVFLKAMQDPNWHDGSKLAQMTKDFRARLLKHIGPLSANRFINKLCPQYIEAVSIEASLRESGRILDLQPYIQLRRENSAIRLCFGLFEMCLGIDLPDEVFEDETIMKAYFAAADHVCWANDVYSYAMEMAKGHVGNNVLSVLMKSRHFSLQQASDFVGLYCKMLVQQFLVASQTLPSFGKEVDGDVQLFIDAMNNWMRGNLAWSFESKRYFGSQVEQIKKDRVISFTPLYEDSDSSEELSE